MFPFNIRSCSIFVPVQCLIESSLNWFCTPSSGLQFVNYPVIGMYLIHPFIKEKAHSKYVVNFFFFMFFSVRAWFDDWFKTTLRSTYYFTSVKTTLRHITLHPLFCCSKSFASTKFVTLSFNVLVFDTVNIDQTRSSRQLQRPNHWIPIGFFDLQIKIKSLEKWLFFFKLPDLHPFAQKH